MISPGLEKKDIESPQATLTNNIGADITRTQQVKMLCSTSLVAFTVIGLTMAFGVFQAHYTRKHCANEGVVRYDELKYRALVSAIGSLSNGGIVGVFAVLYYPYLTRIGTHVRYLCLIGTTCVVIGLATAAASHSVWHLFACQGVMVGIGAGILLNVLAPILTEYFPQRSGLAQGAMYAAAALGGMTLTLLITSLIDHVGTRATLGTLAAFSMITLATASALALPPRKFEKRSTTIVGWAVFKDPLFTCLFVVNFIHPLTLAVPSVFGPLFAESIGVGLTHASYLLAINSGVGIPSRLGAGALADKIGRQNTLLIATSVFAIATWALWLPSALTDSVGLYIGMSVCHGLISGVFVTVMNSAQKELFGDEMYYPKSGALATIRGIGMVVGVPIAGALVSTVADEELHGVDFVRPIVYVGSLLTISIVCLLNVRRLDAKQSGWKWAR